MAWTSLCDLDELTDRRGKYVEIGGFRLAVFLNAGEVYTMDDTCPHAGASMAQGRVDKSGCAVCSRHNWAFNLETGAMAGLPGVILKTYPTRKFEREGKPTIVQADLPIY
jgi:3-phenylpropionate/trans-cinnamate dioxygenase ferredoxin subunit